MKSPRLFLLPLLLLAACTEPRERAEERLREVGVEKLRRDAALLYKNLFAGAGIEIFVVRANDWPKSFQRLAPLRVAAYPDGISLALAAGRRGESGLYIVPWEMDRTPAASGGVTFQKIEEGIFWYSFAK